MTCAKGSKRDSSGDCRNYKKEGAYEATPEQTHHRVERNQARRTLEQEHKVHKGDGREVDHKKSLEHHGSNARSNLQVLSRHDNRVKGAG
jgi:5-methylcytosine-specific restriction endonuclease McrA